MRILFLTHRLPYAPNRGDRIRARQVLLHLATRHDVTLVSFTHSAEEAAHRYDLDGLTRETIVAPVSHLQNGLRAGLALPGVRPLTHVLLDSRAMVPELERLVRTGPQDVVLAYCSSMARFALEPPLHRLPLVVDMVDTDSAKWEALAKVTAWPLSWVYRRESRCLGRFEALVVRRAHASLVVNEREREALLAVAERHGGSRGHGSEDRRCNCEDPAARVVVVPVGVDLESLKPRVGPTRQPVVVFCGVMDYAPNAAGAAWLAEHVWPAVRTQVPDAKLWLVGARPTRSVRRLASRTTGVEVTATVPDVRPYLWDAAVSAAPLHLARGVQNKVLEAVAAGLPAVVTQAVWEGLPPCVLPACRVADEPDAFAAAILELLAMPPDARRKVAESADLNAVTWDACLAPLVPILEEAARAGRVTVR